MATRELRIENMSRETARVNQILHAINETEQAFNTAWASIPSEVAAEASSFVGFGDTPTGNEMTLEDFYVYDYEGEMLPSMVEHLFNQISAMTRSRDFLEEYKQNGVHNMELDGEEDGLTLAQIDRAISDMESAITEASGKHGTFVALSKATDSPNRYSNLDAVMNIVAEYGG